MIPYIGDGFSSENTAPLDPTLFSPNRQFPSAVMFGSLPTGVKRNQPWQTLLFRPARSYLPGDTNHPGAASGGQPADHLILDNFWMPVVEPYAISEPFSTAGKINLNHQIAPFNYITRNSGIRAVLEGTLITALNPAAVPSNSLTVARRYKQPGDNEDTFTRGARGISFRFGIDAENTLKLMDEYVTSKNRPFISASEICEIPLVPDRNDNGSTFATATDTASSLETKLATFWNSHKLTGDNSLERPYAHIYPRVTTKSNTYTVHVRAQRLQVSQAGLAAGQFGTGKGAVTGEFIGAFTIERYLDPNSDSLVKDNGSGNLIPANENEAGAFLGPYKFRVLNTRQLSL